MEKKTKGGRIRFEVRIAINLMHQIRIFESIRIQRRKMNRLIESL